MPGPSNVGLLQCNPPAPQHTVKPVAFFLPEAMPDAQERTDADYFHNIRNPEGISLVKNI